MGFSGERLQSAAVFWHTSLTYSSLCGFCHLDGSPDSDCTDEDGINTSISEVTESDQYDVRPMADTCPSKRLGKKS